MDFNVSHALPLPKDMKAWRAADRDVEPRQKVATIVEPRLPKSRNTKKPPKFLAHHMDLMVPIPKNP